LAAVQVVEQGFELVVVDDVGACADRRDGEGGNGGCRHDGGRCTVAMQGVEQGFEFVVADQVGFAARPRGRDREGRRGRRCGMRHSRGTRRGIAMQGIEQGFELVIGDQPGFAAGAHGRDRQRRCSCGRRGDGFGIRLGRGRDRRGRPGDLHGCCGDIAEQVQQVVVENGGGVHAACSVSRASVSSSQSSARR
jgi:hypothetical protein